MPFKLKKSLLLSVAAVGFAVHPTTAQEAGEPVSTEIEIPVAIGQSVRGIRMPHYEDGGQTLTLRINADSAERTGESTFNFKGLRLELFDDSEETPAMEVILTEAVFDRETNMLTSRTDALIKGPQFEITGSQLEFDSKTRNSRLAGPVVMTLTSTGEDGQP